MLKEYKMIKISIENMENELKHIKQEDGITGTSSGAGGGGGGFSGGVTERTALFNVENTKELKGKIRRAKRQIEALDRALEGLTDVERLVVQGKYMDGLQWYQVAYSVGYSERHCKRIRTSAIKDLVIGVYGK